MAHSDPLSSGTLLAVAVGNTRTRMGLFRAGELDEAHSHPNAELESIVEAARRLAENDHNIPAVMSSVHEPVADRLEARLGEVAGEVYRVGRDIHVPLRHSLDDARTLGQDRQLNALAAYAKARQACVVVDAGTAITVDFIDGEGVFHGGAIAPGLSLMLRSLREGTSALPALAWETPDPRRGPFGKDTRHAMLLGVRGAAQGLVRLLVERYAEEYEAYPQIIATGGDAPVLFENDEVVEHLVPDLQLMGILLAARGESAGEGAGEGDSDEDDDR